MSRPACLREVGAGPDRWFGFAEVHGVGPWFGFAKERGADPDPLSSIANERTFFVRSRRALALPVVGEWGG